MRPTLAEQIAISKLSTEDCIKLIQGNWYHRNIEMFFFNHLTFVWRVANWNWWNMWTEERSFWKFVKHGFREWGQGVKP